MKSNSTAILIKIKLRHSLGRSSRSDFVQSNVIAIGGNTDKVGMIRKSVMLCINKYLEADVENPLFDVPNLSQNAKITDDEKAWIINIACKKPVNLGYSTEVQKYGHDLFLQVCRRSRSYKLITISQSKVRTILERRTRTSNI